MENINEVKLLLSYWNYFIIKNQINPSLCIKGVQPHSFVNLSAKLKLQYLIVEGNLMIYENIYDQLKLQLTTTEEECSSVLQTISQYEKDLQEIKNYLSYLYNVKEIILMV